MNNRKQLILNLLLKTTERMDIPQTLVKNSNKRLWMGDIYTLALELEAEGYIRIIYGTGFTYYRLTMKGEAQAVINGDDIPGVFGIYEESKWPEIADVKLRYVPEELRT